jgi:tetratricopeptide (TPR) repeat protein
MAEGLLEGVLGGEEEKIDPTVAGTEPIVAAVAANLASQHSGVAADTSAMFRKQTEVLELQKKNLAAEYEFFEAEAGPRLLALRLRTGFQLFFALFATVIGLALAIVVWSATRSRSVVIDAFDVPQALAADGLNGKVVASGLLDVLTRIQAASQGPVEHRNLTNAWASEISVDVPDTGISFGQLDRMVRTRVGHDQHIEGDLVRTSANGLALTVRGNGILPKTFMGDAGALEKLLTEAGEYLFSQSQPGLWMAYLTSVGRDDEAIAFAAGAYNTIDPGERPYVLNGWGNAITDKGGEGAVAQALPLWREEVKLKSDYWHGYNNIMFALAVGGDEEGALRVGEQLKKVAGGRPGRAPEAMYANYDELVWDLQAERAGDMADMESHGGKGTFSTVNGAENLSVAQLDVQLHDPEAAALRLQTTLIETKNVPDVAAAAMDRALLAEEKGDFTAAAKEWDVFSKAYADPTVATNNPRYICNAAVSYQKSNQPAKADAALRPFGGGTYLDCYRYRGDVLDLRGDWPGAQEWYAKAVQLGPSLPAGYYSWGLALAKRGDLAGATTKLRLANQKAPHWADPLKVWGDVLVKQGKTKDGLAQYDEALKYAPNWKQLKEAREAAAKLKT